MGNKVQGSAKQILPQSRVSLEEEVKKAGDWKKSQQFNTKSLHDIQELIKSESNIENKKLYQSCNLDKQKETTEVQSSQDFKQPNSEEYIRFDTGSELKQKNQSNFNSTITLPISKINSLVQEMEKINNKTVESIIIQSKIKRKFNNQENQEKSVDETENIGYGVVVDTIKIGFGFIIDKINFEKLENSVEETENFGYGFRCAIDNINHENQERKVVVDTEKIGVGFIIDKINSEKLENSVEVTENIGYGFIIQKIQPESKEQQNQIIQQEEKQNVFGTEQIGESPILFFQKSRHNIFQSRIYPLLSKELQGWLHKFGPFNPPENILYEGTNFQSIQLSDRSEYEGEMYNDKKHGFGFHVKNNKCYEGYFENDKRNGYGREVGKNGDFIIGYWKDDYMEGNVEFKMKEQHFIGFCKKHLIPQGQGFLENLEFKYQGNFINGKQNGKGRKFTFADQTEYFGEFENDRMQGYGEMRFRDKIYLGNFFNNKFEGEGHLTWADGREYIGMFKNNFRHGMGQMRDLDGKLYQGKWEEDEFKE